MAVKDVLIVEDNEGLRNSLATALKADYRIRAATGGLEALRCLERHDVDAILLDLDMQGADAFAVLARAAALRPRPEVVVLSALDEVSVAVKAMRLGASDYIAKPCSIGQVREALRAAHAVPAPRPARRHPQFSCSR